MVIKNLFLIDLSSSFTSLSLVYEHNNKNLDSKYVK